MHFKLAAVLVGLTSLSVCAADNVAVPSATSALTYPLQTTVETVTRSAPAITAKPDITMLNFSALEKRKVCIKFLPMSWATWPAGVSSSFTFFDISLEKENG